MRIYLDQIGCRLNYSEVATLAGQLRQAGHVTVDSAEQAQVIVFNSCAVTAQAGRKSRQRVRTIAAQNPDARIAVTGCWATLQPEAAAAQANVALVVGNDRKELLPALLEPWSAELDDPDDLARMQPYGNPFVAMGASNVHPNVPTSPQLDSDRRGRTRAFIKVQDGCNNRCTFCIVTVARGQSRSRTIAAIVDEIGQLAASGVREAVLTGVHLGSYGRDLQGSAQSDLRALTETVLADTAITRLRLSSLEPWELADGFFDLWQQWPGRLCPHLHLPLQAGTDRQLRRMARRCTTDSFRQLVNDARRAIPDLVITSDLIVGFPGESEEDFCAGLDFVEEMGFLDAHIFPYSARSGTAAAAFGGQLSKTVKKRRSQQMRTLITRSGQRQRTAHLGSVRPVLWEGEGQPLTDEPGWLWSGLTDNYLRVMTVVPDDRDLRNSITSTQLTELQGETIFGTIEAAEIANRRPLNLESGPRVANLLSKE